jgi:multidrug resistance protein, MATE family
MQVQAAVLSCIGLTSLCILIDAMVTVTLGVIKGIGKQAQATVAYLVCFYLISVPASYYFCFTHRQGLAGLYYGLLTGLVVLIFSLSLIIRQADWLSIAF